MPRTILATSAALLLFTLQAQANGYEDYPRPLDWAPDSSKLAAIVPSSWPPNSGYFAGSLGLYSPTGSLLHQVFQVDDSSSLRFSPDGKLLAFVDRGFVNIAELLDDGSTSVTTASEAYYPALDLCWAAPLVSGSGPSLLISGGERYYGSGLYRIDPWLHLARLSSSLGSGSSLYGVEPGRDGSRVWILQQDGYEGSEAYERLCWLPVSSQGGHSPARATSRQEGEYHESNPVQCPDGSVIFQRGGWGEWDLYRLDTESGLDNLLVANAAQPSLSKDGRWLVFLRPNAASLLQAEYAWEALREVWLLDLQSLAERQLSSAAYGAGFPVVSPDGRQIAWLEGLGPDEITPPNPEWGGAPAMARLVCATNPLI